MDPVVIKLLINGAPYEVNVAPDDSLLAVLRRLHLYSTRESCGQGVCGTCTVLVDRRTVASCILFAHLANGSEIETVEGLSDGNGLSPVQEAFVSEAGFQCGFCTPGMIVSATQLLRENPDPNDAEISHYLAGNICRCGAYPEIIRSVQEAARRLKDVPR